MFALLFSPTLSIHIFPLIQTPTPPGTSLILIGALLLVLIILGGVVWVVIRRR